MRVLKRQVKFLNLIESAKRRKELSRVFSKVLSKGIFILGEEVKNFEENFAKYLGIKYCIGVGNGLEALQISLLALGVDQDDEVITTPISAAATTLAILAVGAKPIFVDTTSDGLINSNLITPAITKKTKAIMPVHLYGNPVDLEKIQQICKKYKLFLIEDAAQAHGSKFKGKFLGSFGDLGCFSFYPTKNLGALGDGGAVATNSKKVAQICREFRDYGQKKKYVHVRLGLNSRLDEVQAALLSEKLKSLDTGNKKRRILANQYIKSLSPLKELELVTPQYGLPNFHQFVIKTNKRNALMKYLQNQGVQTLIHYPKIIPDQPFLINQYGKESLPIARQFVKQCLSLPCYPKMSLKDVDFVSENIVNFFSLKSRN